MENASVTWDTANTGEIYLNVWARSAGNTVDAPQAEWQSSFAVSAAVKTVSITAATASPRPMGSSVSFTAASTGGTPPVQYQFMIESSTQTLLGRGWGTDNTFTWRPTTAGTYTIYAMAKTTIDNAYILQASIPFTITP